MSVDKDWDLLVNDYVLGELEPTDAKSIEAYLRVNPKANERAEELRRLYSGLSSIECKFPEKSEWEGRDVGALGPGKSLLFLAPMVATAASLMLIAWLYPRDAKSPKASSIRSLAGESREMASSTYKGMDDDACRLIVHWSGQSKEYRLKVGDKLHHHKVLEIDPAFIALENENREKLYLYIDPNLPNTPKDKILPEGR